MSADFLLKQHLKMSPNATIKNLVPENLLEIPPEHEWKLGRFWFNISIGKLQGVFLKLDRETGKPVQPEEMEIRVVGADALGETKDGKFWPDGLFDFTEQTKIADAMDDVNEALKDLAPPEATMLRGDLQLFGDTFFTGFVSQIDESSPDKFTSESLSLFGQEIKYIVNNSKISVKLPSDGIIVKGVKQQQFGRADQGKIVLVVDGLLVDSGVDLGDAFFNGARDYHGVFQGYDHDVDQMIYDIEGNEVLVEVNPNKDKFISSTGSLVINTVERYNDFKKWQRGSGTVHFTATAGKHVLHVEHDAIRSGTHLNVEIQTSPFKTNNFDFFYDPSKIKPNTSIKNFSVVVGNKKLVSGIPYYNSNIQFEFDFSANHLFDYTYWLQPISIVMDGSDHNLVEWNDLKSNLKSKKTPLWNDEFKISSYRLTYLTKNKITDNVQIMSKAGKPATGWGDETKIGYKILIDTYPKNGNSTSLKETFIDEEYRLDIKKVNVYDIESVISNRKDLWDSAKILSLGEAHQFMGRLIKPKNDFREYGIDVDYSELSKATACIYYRQFYTIQNKPNSNGRLRIVTDGLIGVDFDIFILFPGLTGWLDINELFDVEIFKDNYNMDGVGCATLINKDKFGYEIGWTIGTFSTVNSGFGYLMKVVIKTNTIFIDEIEEISNTWR